MCMYIGIGSRGQGGHGPLTFEHMSQDDSVIIDTWQIASTCSA